MCSWTTGAWTQRKQWLLCSMTIWRDTASTLSWTTRTWSQATNCLRKSTGLLWSARLEWRFSRHATPSPIFAYMSLHFFWAATRRSFPSSATLSLRSCAFSATLSGLKMKFDDSDWLLRRLSSPLDSRSTPQKGNFFLCKSKFYTWISQSGKHC